MSEIENIDQTDIEEILAILAAETVDNSDQ